MITRGHRGAPYLPVIIDCVNINWWFQCGKFNVWILNRPYFVLLLSCRGGAHRYAPLIQSRTYSYIGNGPLRSVSPLIPISHTVWIIVCFSYHLDLSRWADRRYLCLEVTKWKQGNTSPSLFVVACIFPSHRSQSRKNHSATQRILNLCLIFADPQILAEDTANEI